MAAASRKSRSLSLVARLLYLAAAVTYSIEAWIYRGPLHVLIGLALGVLLVIYVEWRACAQEEQWRRALRIEGGAARFTSPSRRRSIACLSSACPRGCGRSPGRCWRARPGHRPIPSTACSTCGA